MNFSITKQKKASFIDDISRNIRHEIRRLSRKKTLLKIKVILLVVLPFLIVLIAAKTVKTYVRIKIRQLAEQHKVQNKGGQHTGKEQL